jgi:methionyl-tRNA formyltransferase
VRIVFLGTPEVAVPALEALVAADDVEVVAVVTNPDRPKGRSKQPVPPPVKVAAERHGLPVWQPVKPIEVVDELAALDVDACAIVAYGALLPRRVLDAGGRGFVNLHFSLLPRWRGAAPVQHAIRAGDEVTGVTCFVLDEGMDTGPVLATRRGADPPRRHLGTLLERLADVGAPVLLDALRRLVAGETPDTAARGGRDPRAQDHPGAHAHRLVGAGADRHRPRPQRRPGARGAHHLPRQAAQGLVGRARRRARRRVARGRRAGRGRGRREACRRRGLR